MKLLTCCLIFLSFAGVEFGEIPGIRPLVTEISCWKIDKEETNYHVHTGRTSLVNLEEEPAFKTIKELWVELKSKCRLSRMIWLRTRYPGTDTGAESSSLSQKEIELLIDLAEKDGIELVPLTYKNGN